MLPTDNVLCFDSREDEILSILERDAAKVKIHSAKEEGNGPPASFNMVASRPTHGSLNLNLNSLKLDKIRNFSSSIPLAAFQVLCHHMWLPDSTG